MNNGVDSYISVSDLTIEQMEEFTRTSPARICGEFHKYFSAETGRLVFKPWYCKDYHNCPKCRARKTEELRQRTSPLSGQDIQYLIVPEEKRAKLSKKYGKENCLFIPHDDQVICLIRTSNNIGIPLTDELVDEICNHAVPPQGKRISGNLGKKASAGPPDIVEVERAEVKRRVFKAVGDKDQPISREEMEDLEREIYQDTKDLNPHTGDEVQWAIYVLEQQMVVAAERRGISIYFLYTETINVILNKIDWSNRYKIVSSA